MIRIRVINPRTGEVLATDAEVARTFSQRFLGLMGRSSLAGGGGLLLYPVNSVHSFFMRFEIDVLHLDRCGRVLRIIAPLRPGRVGPLVWGGVYTLELPAGKAAATRVGDSLRTDPVLWQEGNPD